MRTSTAICVFAIGCLALSAAPAAVAKDATVVRVESDGSMRTLHQGDKGFTCLVMGTDRTCNDANSMEFSSCNDRIRSISDMLAGDERASNTDPFANGKTADNHWIVTGPHIMVFGPPAKTRWLRRSNTAAARGDRNRRGVAAREQGAPWIGSAECAGAGG